MNLCYHKLSSPSGTGSRFPHEALEEDRASQSIACRSSWMILTMVWIASELVSQYAKNLSFVAFSIGGKSYNYEI